MIKLKWFDVNLWIQKGNWINSKQHYVQLGYSLAKEWINEDILNIESWLSMALKTHLNWWIDDLEIIYILNISELTN